MALTLVNGEPNFEYSEKIAAASAKPADKSGKSAKGSKAKATSRKRQNS